MAVNHAGGSHPWENMSDEKLLQSAGLYGTDVATGESGYNLAAILLLGKDEVIQNVCPAYETDALVRKVNVDRALIFLWILSKNIYRTSFFWRMKTELVCEISSAERLSAIHLCIENTQVPMRRS